MEDNMDPQTLQFIVANEMYALHVQIGQLNLQAGQWQTRVAELEAANRLLAQQVKDLKRVSKAS
jgi:hypothetical protein